MKPVFKCLNPLPLEVDFLYDINIPNPYSKENINKEWNPSDYLANEYNRKKGSILAPCGKCYNCRKNRVNEWFIRYLVEKQTNFNDCYSLFITLTYAKLDNPSLDYRDIQLFLKRLRKYFSDYKLKFLCVGEYGFKNNRKHWHLIVLGFKDLPDNYKQVITHLWNKGFTITKVCDENTIYYLLKYSFKQYHKNGEYYRNLGLTPPLFRCSQGFGKDFAELYKDRLVNDKVLSYMGKNYRLPRYFMKILRKFRLIDGWSILENYKVSITKYCINIMNYLGKPLGLVETELFCSLRSLSTFARTVKDFFVDENEKLYYKFFMDFNEVI